jgi:hypothetical protein
MVSEGPLRLFGWVAPLLAEAAPKELPPPTRAAVQMALIAIGLVGLLLIVMILLGGHWVRRQGSHRRGPSVPPDRTPMRKTESQGPSQNDDEVD